MLTAGVVSNILTMGTSDANGQNPKFKSSLRIAVKVGDPNTAGDQADNSLVFSATDVRRKSDLGDYAGELRITATLRMTDKLNGSPATNGGTVLDFPFAAVAPCNQTPTDNTVGSTCALNTTLDEASRGMVKEGARTVTHFEDVRIFDGGTDGDADTTPDNTLFAWEGVFTP